MAVFSKLVGSRSRGIQILDHLAPVEGNLRTVQQIAGRVWCFHPVKGDQLIGLLGSISVGDPKILKLMGSGNIGLAGHEQGRTAAGEKLQPLTVVFPFDETQNTHAIGVGGEENVVKTETQQTFVNGLLGFITLGIYTPLEARVYCSK